MSKLTLPHEELMHEEQLKYSDLPEDIREEIDEIEDFKKEYNEAPSESGKNLILRTSVQIADSIQDYLEKDLPDNDEEDEEEDLNDDQNTQTSVNKNNEDSELFPQPWKFWK